MKLKSYVIFLLAFSLVNIAGASEQVDQWYVNGMITYIDPDSKRDLDDEIAGGQISLGRAFTDHLNGEVEFDLLDVSGDGGPDQDLMGVALNGLFVFNREGSFSPYLLGGVGFLNVDVDGVSGDDTDWQLQAGPGFLWDLGTERLSLRAEALGRWADSSPNATDLLVNVGVQWAFGGKKEEPAPVVVAPPPPPPPGDEDGDGVTDDIDQCPGTPAGATVDAVGCPMDSDGDGVLDGIDQCPDTIKGALIDAVGCGYQLSGVNFGFDSDELQSDGKELLDEVAVRLDERKDVNITIEGYTDSRGDDGYNLDLSRRRAQSAKDELVAKGVAGSRISVVGKGEADPVASNDTDEGRAENRRVVLKVDQ